MDPTAPGGAFPPDELPHEDDLFGEAPSDRATLLIETKPWPGSWLLRLAKAVSRMNPARWFRRD